MAKKQADGKSGVLRVLSSILKDGDRYEAGDDIVVTASQAEQLVEAKAARYLTEAERSAADKARAEQK